MQIFFMTQNLKTLFRITCKQTMKGRIKLPKPQRILSGNQNSEKARQVAVMAGEITVYRDTLSLIVQNFEEPAAAVLLQGLIKRSERTIKTINNKIIIIKNCSDKFFKYLETIVENLSLIHI